MSVSVIVLGAGGMGSVAAATAARLEVVSKVCVADIDLARAEAVARHIGERAEAARVDVRSVEQLTAILSGYDIVLNCTGPFYELGPHILDAAIAAGTHYSDICDDWEPTLELLERGTDAQKAGVVAVVGMGASPGITNLLAVKVASELDHVDEILTGWTIEDDVEEELTHESGEPSAATIHWLQQLTGTIRQMEGGKMGDYRPLQNKIIQYPTYGDLSVWSVGHPEAVTLPRVFTGLRHCSNVMVGDEAKFGTLKEVAALVDDQGMTVREAAARIGPALYNTPQDGSSGAPKPSVFAWAKGRSNGEAVVVGAQLIAAPAGGMGGVTGVPLALAVPQIIRLIEEKKWGVFTAEEAINPDSFFDDLAPHCGIAPNSGRSVYYMSSEAANG